MNGGRAYCGLSCDNCLAYQATVNNDDQLREETAAKWRQIFSPNIQAADIQCLGCKSEVRFGYCASCGIRSCSVAKGLENCGECDAFSCDKTEQFFKHAPEAKTYLAGLRTQTAK
jgi:hypothetical protein